VQPLKHTDALNLTDLLNSVCFKGYGETVGQTPSSQPVQQSTYRMWDKYCVFGKYWLRILKDIPTFLFPTAAQSSFKCFCIFRPYLSPIFIEVLQNLLPVRTVQHFTTVRHVQIVPDSFIAVLQSCKSPLNMYSYVNLWPSQLKLKALSIPVCHPYSTRKYKSVTVEDSSLMECDKVQTGN